MPDAFATGFLMRKPKLKRVSRPPAFRWSKYISADIAAFVAAFAAPLLLYAMTMPRTVYLEDDGLFLAVARHLGVAHPPGYPLYTLLGYVFMQLPFSTPAAAGHFYSAFFGALACSMVYACCRHFGASVLASLAGALLFAASEHFWSQVIIAEVYAMNTFILFACYALLLRSSRSERPVVPLFLAAAAYGFGLANHWPLVGLATPGLILAAIPAWRTVFRNLPALAGTSLLCAALPYAWMVWRSNQDPLLAFYGKIRTLEEFWYYVSRQGYADVDQSATADWTDKINYMLWLGGEVARQTTYLGFALAAVGISVIFLRHSRVAALSGVVMFLGLSVFLILLLGFDYEPFRVGLFRPYSIAIYGLVAIWLAVGLHWTIERARDRFPPGFGGGARYFAPTANALAGLAMLAVSLDAGLRRNNLADHDFTERHATAVFDRLPENSVFFVYGDATGPFAYYSLVENLRPDIKLYNVQGLVLNDRIYSPYTTLEAIIAKLGHYIDNSERPVFFMLEGTLPDRGVNTSGFMLEAIPNSEKTRTGIQVHKASQEFFLYLIGHETENRWEMTRRGELLLQFGQYLAIAYHSGNTELLAQLRHLYKPCESSYHCLLGFVDILLRVEDAKHHKLIASTLDMAEAMIDQALTKSVMGRLYVLRGDLLATIGQPNDSRISYQRAFEIYPSPEIDKLISEIKAAESKRITESG